MSTESILTKSTFSINREKMVHKNSNEQELISSTISEDSQTPLSETVTTLASNVYKELERIIKNFGENSVKDLMPVMISTLESLDNALHEREVGKFEIESLKEQNEQLFQQYEREKSFHKEYQQRYLQVEDHLEEIKRENEEKLQSLESIVKIFEIKARNASDHVGRLEDKENDMKQEYKRLHDRYCELFKAHCDYMEKTKILYGTDRLDQLSATSQSRGNLPLSNENQSISNEPSPDEKTSHRPDISLPSYKQSHIGTNFRSELGNADGKHTQTESLTSNDAAVNTAKLSKLTMMDEISLKEFTSDNHKSYLEKYKQGIFSKLRTLNLLSEPVDEQQFFVNEDEFNNTTDPAVSDDDDDISVDETKNLEAFDKETRNENIDITDIDASADLFVRQSFYGMTKEVSNLIKENNELLETKNALNVLKDDLLVKIEELSNEQEILREEVDSLQTVRGRLQSRITEVEDELRKTRDELEKKKEEEKPLMISKGIQTITHQHQQPQQQTVQENPSSSLPDAIPSVTKSTSKSLWRMFSDDWLPTSIVPSNILGVPVVDIQSDLREGTTQISEFFSGLFGSNIKDIPPKRATASTTTTHLASSAGKDSPINDQIAPTEESFIATDDDTRVDVYGWSLPSKSQSRSSDPDGKVQIQVPVPVYCRPIFNTNDKTQIWCAVGIDLNGLKLETDETSVDQLNKQLIESYHQMIDEQFLKLSSIVWIAAKSNDTATITIIDSNKAEKIIDTFTLGNAIIYAMGSVPGISSTDYPLMDDAKLNEKISNSEVKVTVCTVESLSTSGIRSVATKTLDQIPSDISHQTVNEKRTKYPTVWLGSSDGWLYIHSAIDEHRTSIGKVWLHHAIYSIVHIRGRIFVSMANEKIIVFHRHTDGTWNLNNFHLIQTGKSRESVRCAINVGESIWFGVANRVYIIDVQTLEIRKQFEVHSRPEHSVQHMTWSDDGVWLSVRLSSTLQLYHTHTFEHLQDVDIQPYIEKMIPTEKTGLYFVHISALTIACRRLWIGTGNGIIISVPLSDSIAPTSTKPDSIVRTSASASNYIPYCSMTNAQLSFHGYRDAVKFFVAVPGQPTSKILHNDEMTLESLSSISPFGDILVVSGGDGYIDFRVENTTTTESDNNRHVSYLTIWHLGST